MKDTVIVFVNDYKLFVGDYYQGKIKQVKFKSQDYWEVFESCDMKDFLEYMNYPLGYKNFKESNLKFYFNKPLAYSYIYEVKDKLQGCEAFGIGRLEQLIVDIVKKKEALVAPIVVECLESQYLVEHTADGWNLNTVEDQENTVKLTIEELCEHIIAEGEQTQTIEVVLGRYVCFSPATIALEITSKTKHKYLEVENRFINCVTDGTEIALKQDVLSYEQIVYKMFGKKEIKLLNKKAPQEGQFVRLWMASDEYFAKKDEVIGIIAPINETREQTLAWFNQYIKREDAYFSGCTKK